MVDNANDSSIRWSGQGLCKSYAVPVLQGIDLELRGGSVLALLGANGAGKSTLGKIIAGLIRPESGAMQLDGITYAPRDQHEAQRQGVHIVLQELNVFDTLNVAENLFLGHLPNRFGWINRSQLRQQAHEALERVGLGHLEPTSSPKSLGVGEKQLLEIARALSQKCRVLIFDEPTAALTAPQVNRLFDQIRGLKQQGVAMVYVSHRLDEIRQIADHVAILRDGRLVETGSPQDFDVDRVVRAMSGKSLETSLKQESRVAHQSPAVKSGRSEKSQELIRVSALASAPRVKAIELVAHAGEIVGIAGLVGAGRTETLRAIAGADQAESGIITLAGRETRRPFRSVREALRAGIVMVPEDRKTQGLLLPSSIAENTTLGIWNRGVSTLGWIHGSHQKQSAQQSLEPFEVRCSSVEQRVAELSGGNQQKVLVARSLRHSPRVLLVDEPTRGIDVEAKRLLHATLRDWASHGNAVIVVSSDLAELLELSDSICVMHDGRTLGQKPVSEFDEYSLLEAVLGDSITERVAAEATQ